MAFVVLHAEQHSLRHNEAMNPPEYARLNSVHGNNVLSAGHIPASYRKR